MAIAVALIDGPELLLADEPTGNLDSATCVTIVGLFKQPQPGGLTIIVMTHNETPGRAAPRQLGLRDGSLV